MMVYNFSGTNWVVDCVSNSIILPAGASVEVPVWRGSNGSTVYVQGVKWRGVVVLDDAGEHVIAGEAPGEYFNRGVEWGLAFVFVLMGVLWFRRGLRVASDNSE